MSFRETKTEIMANLQANFLGVKSPNPYWLASAPPTDKKINVLRKAQRGKGKKKHAFPFAPLRDKLCVFA